MNEKLNEWLKDEYEKLERKPEGMYGNWAWRTRKVQEYYNQFPEEKKE